MATQKYKLTEAELRDLIKEVVVEAIVEEGAIDYIKGMGRAVADKFSSAGQSAGRAVSGAAQNMRTKAQNIGQNVKDATTKAAENVRTKVNNAGQAINKQVQDIKTAGQQASMQADHRRNLQQLQKQNNKIVAQLNTWKEQGVFKSKQANSAVSQLIKALQNNYDATDANQQAEYNSRFNG